MRKPLFFSSLFLFVCLMSIAQKKPLDHSVYDSWQSVGEKLISNNGKFVVYTINPQEGDGTLVIQKTDGIKLLEIERGYLAKITGDSKYVICKIKPTFQQTRIAKVQKKKGDDLPKDSLAVVNIQTLSVAKIPRIKKYTIAEKNNEILAYLSEKALPEMKPKAEPDSLARIAMMNKMADSLTKVADSLKNKIVEAKEKGMKILQSKKETKSVSKSNDEAIEEGTELTILNLNSNERKTFSLVNDYAVSKIGNSIVIETSKKKNDSLIKACILKFNVKNNVTDTLLKGLNDAKGFAWDDAGTQLAFVAERDSAAKALQKFYKLYYYKQSYDSAILIADKNTKGMPKDWMVSEFSNITFSKTGNRLFFGTAPILPPKDTTLPEFERVSVDVWNYKDDDLMTVQLYNLERELKRNYVARYDFDKKEVVQLANKNFERMALTEEGDGEVFYTTSDSGRRVERQWQGYTLEDVYAINPVNGAATLIVKNVKGRTYPSYTGKYLVVYNEKQKKYFAYNSQSRQLYQIAKDIPYPLYNEDNDVPDDPNEYGIVDWLENDKAVFIYDKYDIWKVDPDGKNKSVCITNGRKNKIVLRYVNVDRDEKFIKNDAQLVLRAFNDSNKTSGLTVYSLKAQSFILPVTTEKTNINSIARAKDDSSVFILTKESFVQSPNVYSFKNQSYKQLSDINLQQKNYNWGTAELYKWKAYTGKLTEGVLYKPEDFNAKKKYPMIVYFYERNNQTLYNYQAPAPTPSRLNIPFFVSRGYVVFVPDIWYTTGHPGKDAYNYIVSGTRALIKLGFIDSTKLGIQGQSWGGYQTAYVITQTNLYAAAWAGAPVVNMFSAYGGIRWESGLNRQFQYEHSQSRIGATPWGRKDLYIENSPLFQLPKVKTPLVIMSNDADGAVPWYQGIEFFTDMRRLNKPVWLLNYNGEAHNLVERKNRKDIQIREQQFFDWLLKGEKPAKWITDGVPAVMKGRDLGLEIN